MLLVGVALGWVARDARVEDELPAPARQPRAVDRSQVNRVWLTSYCSCSICTGRSSPDVGGHGLTRAGTRPRALVTVAADPAVFPIGTILELNGHRRVVVEDTGNLVAGHQLDVYLGSSAMHDDAVQFGVRRRIEARVISWGRGVDAYREARR
jgi:3D (Asp-Asp-Asp) domain-containing protein